MYIITQNSDSFLTKNSEVTVYVQLLHTYGDTYVLLQKKRKKNSCMYVEHVYKIHVQYIVITYDECDESLLFKVIIIPLRRISCDGDDATLIQIIEAQLIDALLH